jgi:glycosyltransferase involved in cell wall biosynthesis
VELVNKYKQQEIDNSTFCYIKSLRQSGKFIVLYTGAIVHSNKIHVLVEVADLIKSNKNISIVVVGDGQDKERINNLIKEYALTNIKLVSPVKKSLLPVLLKQADGLLLAQGKVLWGSSNKLSDYLAAAKPIISAVHAKHNDPVSKAGCGISVIAENSQSIAEGIIKLFNLDKTEREKMGQLGFDFLKENFDIKMLADKMESLLNKLVKEGKQI